MSLNTNISRDDFFSKLKLCLFGLTSRIPTCVGNANLPYAPRPFEDGDDMYLRIKVWRNPQYLPEVEKARKYTEMICEEYGCGLKFDRKEIENKNIESYIYKILI